MMYGTEVGGAYTFGGMMDYRLPDEVRLSCTSFMKSSAGIGEGF